MKCCITKAAVGVAVRATVDLAFYSLYVCVCTSLLNSLDTSLALCFSPRCDTCVLILHLIYSFKLQSRIRLLTFGVSYFHFNNRLIIKPEFL